MSSFLRAPSSVASGAIRSGLERVSLRPVALPRKMTAARPATRIEKATLAASPVTTEVVVLSADTYHDFLAQHAEKLICIDYYAQWCGPCKMIAPELDRMAAGADPSKMIFGKLDCGATNESKKLAMSLNIKALPTFHLYRDSKIVDSMTGAKVKNLQELISKHM